MGFNLEIIETLTEEIENPMIYRSLFLGVNLLPKLFDILLAGRLSELSMSLNLAQRAAALNREGFTTYTGLSWNVASLRKASRHAARPRPVHPGSARPRGIR